MKFLKIIKSLFSILIITFLISLTIDFFFGKKILEITDGYWKKTEFYGKIKRIDHDIFHHGLKPNVEMKNVKGFDNYYTFCTDNHAFRYKCNSQKRGKTFDYGKWRINKQNQIIKTIDISNETPLIEKYDAITCFEVLQHVINPKKTLGHLREHLKDEGLVFITTRFKNNYSLALKHNEYLENEFEDFVKKCNFQIKNKIHMWGEKEKTKNLYVLTK